MKLIYAVIAISFVGSFALACPNLNGSWACRSADGQKSLKLKLSTLYTTEGTYLMSNKETYLLDVGNVAGKDGIYNASCGETIKPTMPDQDTRVNKNVIRIKTEGAQGVSEVKYSLKSKYDLEVTKTSPGGNVEVMSCINLSLVD